MIRLIFLGDVGVPAPVTISAPPFAAFEDADLVVANLEGAILDAEERRVRKRRGPVAIHNSPAVVDALRAMRVDCVGLANNHMYDYDVDIGDTRERLGREGIGSFGAGADVEEAASPFVFEAGGREVKLFSFGWPVIGCDAAGAGRAGVNPLLPGHALETARRARAEDDRSLIVFVMHWNYELEVYPQPAHRQLARDLVSAGVDAVVGGHPHVAGGVEMMDGKPVAYSLGNWLFPPRDADGFQLSYPAQSNRQLALELGVDGRDVREVRLRWHHYDPATGEIRAASVEGVDGAVARELTPFAGLSDAEYVAWFRDHRTRRKGLPVYADYRSPSNAGRDLYLRLRRGAGGMVTRLGLKREQRR